MDDARSRDPPKVAEHERPTMPSWQSRQADMEAWYQLFLRDRGESADISLGNEYQPYAHLLSRLRGRILDLGGGAGLTRRYLGANVDYVVVDPSAIWAGDDWRQVSARFASGGTSPNFVRGVGETLPFADAAFDAVVAFWSLNHAAVPARCIAEVARVLRPGGTALLVLEDMEPSWADVARLAWQEVRRRRLRQPVPDMLEWHQTDIDDARKTRRRKLSRHAWPLQDDHVRITERDLRGWCGRPLAIVDRSWEGGFLSFEFRRR